MNKDEISQNKNPSLIEKQRVSVNRFLLTQKFLESKEQFDNFEIYDDDIWVSTFPKSGTTWTQEMTWLIANNLDYEKAKQHIDIRFPYFEFSIFIQENKIKEQNFDIKPFLADSLNFVKNMKRPRFIKTHLSFPLFPKQIQNGEKKPKIIYVARDPKDICVSYYYHQMQINGFNLTFNEYCEQFLAGQVKFGPYWNHVLAFWKLRHQPNILFIKYEDMKKDLKTIIIKVAKFLNRPLNDNQVEKLSQHLSFNSMKNNKAVNQEETMSFFQNLKGTPKENNFFRKGVVGDHKNIMSPELIERFDKWIQENTQGTDYVV